MTDNLKRYDEFTEFKTVVMSFIGFFVLAILVLFPFVIIAMFYGYDSSPGAQQFFNMKDYPVFVAALIFEMPVVIAFFKYLITDSVYRGNVKASNKKGN